MSVDHRLFSLRPVLCTLGYFARPKSRGQTPRYNRSGRLWIPPGSLASLNGQWTSIGRAVWTIDAMGLYGTTIVFSSIGVATFRFAWPWNPGNWPLFAWRRDNCRTVWLQVSNRVISRSRDVRPHSYGEPRAKADYEMNCIDGGCHLLVCWLCLLCCVMARYNKVIYQQQLTAWSTVNGHLLFCISLQ